MEKLLQKYLPNGRFGNVTAVRSRMMGAVKGRGNRTTEQRLRLAFVRAGLSGWRVRASDLPGKPDFYFVQSRVAVFVDGCFWHGCTRCGHTPKTNPRFWAAKIERNRQRDRKVGQHLRRIGIKVVRFWEHELAEDLAACVEELIEMISPPRRRGRDRPCRDRVPKSGQNGGPVHSRRASRRIRQNLDAPRWP